MPSYTPPIRDLQFVLHDVLKLSQSDLPGHDELAPDFTEAVLEAAGKLSAEVLAPLNLSGDQEGCVLENGVVRTPKGFREAFEQVHGLAGHHQPSRAWPMPRPSDGKARADG